MRWHGGAVGGDTAPPQKKSVAYEAKLTESHRTKMQKFVRCRVRPPPDETRAAPLHMNCCWDKMSLYTIGKFHLFVCLPNIS